MGDLGKYLLYFLLGGSIVSFSTYLGAQGKSFLAAMASTLDQAVALKFVRGALSPERRERLLTEVADSLVISGSPGSGGP